MNFIDTHAHLYADEFNPDRKEMIQRCIEASVNKIVLPNIDSSSIIELKRLVSDFPDHCFAMMGLHPCAVTKDFESELEKIKHEIYSGYQYWAVGEIGIDLYWDKTLLKEQESAFIAQCNWALDLQLPIAIHTRNAHKETIACLKSLNKQPGGVFHCFGGTADEAQEIIQLGYFLGIGGVVTYKNSILPSVLKSIDLKHIILETDAPYLPPVPYRGKRNESSYITQIANKLAEIYNVNVVEIADRTTHNAEKLFKLN